MARASRLKQKIDWREMARVADYDPRALAQFCALTLRQLEGPVLAASGLTLGLTPRQWLNELPLLKALDPLRKLTSIKEVLDELGFKIEQRSHFSRALKNFHGFLVGTLLIYQTQPLQSKGGL